MIEIAFEPPAAENTNPLKVAPLGTVTCTTLSRDQSPPALAFAVPVRRLVVAPVMSAVNVDASLTLVGSVHAPTIATAHTVETEATRRSAVARASRWNGTWIMVVKLPS